MDLYEGFGIEAPVIEWQGWKLIRVSVRGYNSRTDTRRLMTALGELLPD